MSQELKNTLEQDTENQDIDTQNTADEVDEQNTLDEEEHAELTKHIEEMTDEEFMEYMNSGTSPDNSSEKEINTNTSVDANTDDAIVEDDTTNNEKETEQKETSVDTKKSAKQDASVDTTTTTIDTTKDISVEELKTVYDNIFKPFKANGKEITPKTLDDVISLMQMGANYTKKMQLLAPAKKAIESLNKADIKEDDLNFLIDVYKGDKEAIKKLLEKHKVDPIDLDMENTNYVPKNNIVSDSDIEYADILEEIKPSLPKIQDIMTNKWDAKSKESLLKDPQLIKALHEEIEMGRFDEVQNMVELEKMFGRHKGKSDIDIYIDIVTQMVANKNIATPSNTTNNKTIDTNKTVTKPIPDKSKAAPVHNKRSNQGTTLTREDIFSMSTEEFNKLTSRDLV